MKRFYLTFTLPILLLAVSCSDSDTPGGEPSPSDPREECRFSNVKATPAATSATAAVTYTCEGEATVTDAGFLLKKAGQSAETRQSCGTAATSLRYTFTGLSENTSYEVAAYVVTPSKTWRSTAVGFTTEAGAVTPPDNNTRHKGWAELPNEVSNGDYLYVDHECAME